MTTEFFPEQTIRYKTFAKRTLVEGLSKVFHNHPDPIVQHTKATIEFPKSEADYPAVIVRFFERDIMNAGVGHSETIYIDGETDSKEIVASVPASGGQIQLDWPPIPYASKYKIYRGTTSNKENQVFTVTTNSFTDRGIRGVTGAVPNDVTSTLDPPSPIVTILPVGNLNPGKYYYRVTALSPSQAVVFKHYFYTADIEFAVYALSSLDRDLIADTLVQTIAMGPLESYTNTFFDRVYPSNAIVPDSNWHFINVNSDRMQGFGESQAQVPWGAEDDLMYMTSYRFGIFGEIYSLPPKLTYAMVRQVLLYPYIDGVEPQPEGTPDDDGIWTP